MTTKSVNKRRKTGGRQKGTQNKFTRSVKDVFARVFHDLQTARNSSVSLKAWAKENPTEFYKLAVRLIPSEISGPNGGPIKIKANVKSDNSDFVRLPIDPVAAAREYQRLMTMDPGELDQAG